MSYEDLEKRIDNLRDDLTESQKDIAAIKTHVTNHIPHILEEHGKLLRALEARLQPVETVRVKAAGISEFLTGTAKFAVSLAAVTWSILQIIRYFIK